MSHQINPYDCPLCGQKEAIPFKDMYDYNTHAEVCRALVNIPKENRECLLQSKTEGIATYLKSDSLDIADYDFLLRKKGFYIRPILAWEKRKTLREVAWRYAFVIDSLRYPMRQYNSASSNYPEAKGKYPDKVFGLLRHFLLSGEGIRIARNGAVKTWRWDCRKNELMFTGVEELSGKHKVLEL